MFLKAGKEMWVVVTTETIHAFKDKDEKELKWACKTSGLKLEDVNPDGKEHSFRIFHPDGNVKMYKDLDHVVFHTAHKDTKTAWQASLLRAGVYPVKEKKQGDRKHLGMLTPEPAFSHFVPFHSIPPRCVRMTQGAGPLPQHIATTLYRDVIPPPPVYMPFQCNIYAPLTSSIW